MKGIAHVKMMTTPNYGGSSIWMFERNIEFFPTLRDWITFIETDLIHISDVGNTTLTQLKPINIDTFSACAHLCIPASKDNLVYYQSLIKDGWIANHDQAERIRESGYSNFKPDLFHM